jgi:hypothetical protein
MSSALRAFCPRAVTSSAVPDCGKVWLNIDFVPGRKIVPGAGRAQLAWSRQNLPGAAEIAGSDRQKLPLFIKCKAAKPRKTAEKSGSRRHSQT